MMKNKLLLLAAVLFVGVLGGCGNSPEDDKGSTDATDTTETKLKVVSTNSIIGDMVEKIGGNLIDAHSIVPVGTDPHEYEPLPEDIRKASEADVVFYNGLNLETGNGWFDKLMETAGKEENEDYFAVSKDVEPINLTGNSSQQDPHAWLDISNGILYITEIIRVMSEKDPENKEAYEKNADAYIAELTELDSEAKKEFADIPEEKKLLVTSEGAFKYFSKAYELQAAYIWEINTEGQGTPDQMKQIIEKVRNSEVRVLFVETSVDHRSMERLSNEVDLPVYSNLFTDSIANEGEDGDSYYEMMKWNLEKIHEGLSQ
ncbi:adhesion lipoprotein [Trichococcus pasteurii]|uniref:Adhesion lipoprotein n=2 Tax=Trichococcus pasteurii TaxID=43064 RepID=A0A1W1IF54_9LACT|nr:iron/zinc/copper transport system substrate-binding protein [Trichococcus pasteurii]SLM51636.1 adhesion lipoprotein [Trichococcus pasteurii]SSB92517.1 adhesion lipoprotein [Trichococcus pasteurii]